ncbi:MAG: PLP-dependent aminotransferase family protein [Halothermotrichaceae bacterium]
MSSLFAERMLDIPKSFIREILKVAVDPEIISFAGGLPNKELFPVADIQEAARSQFELAGKEILQYTTTEGYLPLRQYIADRYKENRGIEISPQNILITSGSQQALDLLAKIFLNKDDKVILEEPGYLGAIQAFSIYAPEFKTVPLHEDGLDIKSLKQVLGKYSPKLMYTVPNFQNPSGISYTEKNRKQVADLMRDKEMLIIEDDPYGDLRYVGENILSFKQIIPEQSILLGSFSKTVAPGFRIGWVVAPEPVFEKLVIAKQASDLHTNYVGQRILYQYLATNDLDQHVARIKECYNKQREVMLDSIEKYFPKEIECTQPEGGMFLWAELPEGLSAMDLFETAIDAKVAFVPGDPFYIDQEDVNTLRLNFSCVAEDQIDIGIKRLGKAIKEML